MYHGILRPALRLMVCFALLLALVGCDTAAPPVAELAPIRLDWLESQSALDLERAWVVAQATAEAQLPGARLWGVQFVGAPQDVAALHGTLTFSFLRERPLLLRREMTLLAIEVSSLDGSMRMTFLDLSSATLNPEAGAVYDPAYLRRVARRAGEAVVGANLPLDAQVRVSVDRLQSVASWFVPKTLREERLFCLVGNRAVSCPPYSRYSAVPRPVVRQHNALWLGVEWLSEPKSDEAIAELAQQLATRQIDTVYAYATYLRPDGSWSATATHAASFTRRLRATYPTLSLQAWIGLPLDRPALLLGGRGYVVLDQSTRVQIATECARLVREGGFDGVHLDPEPIPSGDEEVLRLLEEVRVAIGPEATLSIATRRMDPLTPWRERPAIQTLGWSAEYYRQVARRVDQIAVMTYDSALPWPAWYRAFVRKQVVGLSRALAGEDVDLYIGVPTSEERTLTHWPKAENMTSGLEGVLEGLADLGSYPVTVTGVAIYPAWETSAGEWAEYAHLWLGCR